MRWLILVAVIGAIIWSANWSYHYVDNAVLITDFWEAGSAPDEWGLVDFKGNKPIIYEYTGTKGFWDIFKGLWPLWTLFFLSFFVLAPLSRYIYNGLNDAQIVEALEIKQAAEEQAKKAESDAESFKQEAKSWAEEKVNQAYQEQLSRVRKELENEWNEYHRLKNDILERESTIQRREQHAQEKEEYANQRVAEIQRRYQIEKAQFEKTLEESTKTKKNAQSGQKRLRKEKELIKGFLNHRGWTVEEEPLTYEKLKDLSKAKQP